jgi:hypothetical protein
MLTTTQVKSSELSTRKRCTYNVTFWRVRVTTVAMETQPCMPVELHVTDRYNIKIASFAPKNFMAYLWSLQEYNVPRPSRKVPDIFVKI